jgi:hypothetical protein
LNQKFFAVVSDDRLNGVRSDQAEDAFLETFQDVRIVLNFRLHDQPALVTENLAREFNRILGLQKTFGCRIAQCASQILHGSLGKFVRLFPDMFVLGAQLGANRREWATANFPKFLVFVDLIQNHLVTEIFETLQRGHLGGKNLVHEPAFFIPMIFKGGRGEIGLRFEGVIEASFVDAGPITDVIDADRTIATFPDEGRGGIEELLFGVTLALHEDSLVDWLV